MIIELLRRRAAAGALTVIFTLTVVALLLMLRDEPSSGVSNTAAASRMDTVVAGFAAANELSRLDVQDTTEVDVRGVSGDRNRPARARKPALVSNARGSDGRQYLCFVQPAGSGGCAAKRDGDITEVLGGVTLIADDLYEIGVVVPRATRSVQLLGREGQAKELELDRGVAVTTASSAEIARIVLTRANGTTQTKDLLTP